MISWFNFLFHSALEDNVEHFGDILILLKYDTARSESHWDHLKCYLVECSVLKRGEEADLLGQVSVYCFFFNWSKAHVTI